MPQFSMWSISKLSTCHKDLQTLFNEVIKNFDCIVLEGHRDQAAQDKAFSEGKSQLKYPDGKHNSNPSHAVDVSPYPIIWSNINRFYWFAGYVMGIAQKLYDEKKMTHKIRFGGDWNNDKNITDNKFNDLVHYEIITQDKQ